MNDGIIEPEKNSDIGFDPEIFDGVIFKCGDDVWISLIFVKPSRTNEGNFTRLVERLCDYNIKLPCPSRSMRQLAHKLGFVEEFVHCKRDSCPVLTKSKR